MPYYAMPYGEAILLSWIHILAENRPVCKVGNRWSAKTMQLLLLRAWQWQMDFEGKFSTGAFWPRNDIIIQDNCFPKLHFKQRIFCEESVWLQTCSLWLLYFHINFSLVDCNLYGRFLSYDTCSKITAESTAAAAVVERPKLYCSRASLPLRSESNFNERKSETFKR